MAKSLLGLIVLAGVFASSSAVQCYLRSGSSTTSNGLTATCSAVGAMCFSYTDTSGNQGTGCGMTCASTSAGACYNCSTDLCNTVTPSAISCYSRSSSSASAVSTACPTGITSCYTVTSGGETGCGACASSTGCTTCSTSLCNTVSSGTGSGSTFSCYSGAGVSSVSVRTTTTCSGYTSCYSYNYNLAGTQTYVSGCGTCAGISYSSCVACTTSLCNSPASAVTVSAKLMLAVLVILALMKML